MLDKTRLRGMAATNGVVDALSFKKSADKGEGERLPSSIGDNMGAEKGGGVPCVFAAMLATWGDIDADLHDQRPPHKPPDLPQCYASDLRVPRSYQEAIQSEHAQPMEGFDGTEFYGLLGAGTFEPTEQPVDNFVNAMWNFDWKAYEYGWPTKNKASLVARGDEQRADIHFGELFAPTVAVSSVRLLAAMVCEWSIDAC